MFFVRDIGKQKLGLDLTKTYSVFDEQDGTEIDDDDCLLSYEKGSGFIIGEEWTGRDVVMTESGKECSLASSRHSVSEKVVPVDIGELKFEGEVYNIAQGEAMDLCSEIDVNEENVMDASREVDTGEKVGWSRRVKLMLVKKAR